MASAAAEATHVASASTAAASTEATHMASASAAAAATAGQRRRRDGRGAKRDDRNCRQNDMSQHLSLHLRLSRASPCSDHDQARCEPLRRTY
jgi:hypothetical protein